jgi:hypothetical protein
VGGVALIVLILELLMVHLDVLLCELGRHGGMFCWGLLAGAHGWKEESRSLPMYEDVG